MLLAYYLWPWRKVPNVTGMAAPKAWAVLVDLDFVPVGTSHDSEGIVSTQSPQPGTRRRKRTQVQVLLTSE